MSSSNKSLIFEPIDESDMPLIASFDCGHEGLNNFLFEKSLKYHNDMLGATTLIVDENTKQLIGYTTLKNTSLLYNLDDNKIRGIPATEISNLAIDKRFQNKGLGTQILKALIYKIYENSLEFSSTKAIVLYSLKNERCIKFYSDNGFIKLENFMGLVYDECKNLTVPMYLRL